MFQAMHECGRGTRRIAGEEYGGAGNPLRRALLQHRHQIGKRKLQLARFLEQKPAAATPGVHQQHRHAAKRQRHPAALEHLQKVGRKENQVNEQKWRNQRSGRER